MEIILNGRPYYLVGDLPVLLQKPIIPSIIAAIETLAYIAWHLQENEFEIKIDPQLGYHIPLELFKEQVSSFFSKLCY